MGEVQAVNERASPDTRHILAPLVAGASSGLAASFIRVPTEVVKQRMQSGNHHCLSPSNQVQSGSSFGTYTM